MKLCITYELYCVVQLHQGHHLPKKSDVSSDVIAQSPNSASLSNECLVAVTSNGTYGFVYRNGTNMLPQRSLESPGLTGTCDILLDLERSSRSCSEEMSASRAPDLMSKSYHDQYHDVPWIDHRMRMLHMSGAQPEMDWRHNALLSAQVVTCIDSCVYRLT